MFKNRAEVTAQVKELQALLKEIDAQIRDELQERTVEARELTGKISGVINLSVDGLHLKATAKKDYVYDQKILSNVADSIRSAGGNPHEWLKITYSVEQKKLKTMPESERRAIQAGVSVKISPDKYEMVED